MFLLHKIVFHCLQLAQEVKSEIIWFLFVLYDVTPNSKPVYFLSFSNFFHFLKEDSTYSLFVEIMGKSPGKTEIPLCPGPSLVLLTTTPYRLRNAGVVSH